MNIRVPNRSCMALLACVMLQTVLHGEQVTLRPLSDFLNTQGTFCVNAPTCLLFVPPVPNFVGLDDTHRLKMSVDYANLVDRCWHGLLPTTTEGIVIERPMPDGRAEVEVTLHTRNALVWVALDDYATGTMLFGQRWNAGGKCGVNSTSGLTSPSLGDSFLNVTFIISKPQAPLPDLLEALNGTGSAPQLTSFKLEAKAYGPLYNMPGTADGTLGEASAAQIFMLNKPQVARGGTVVARIDLKALGQR